MQGPQPFRVVVAGGGIAGLEALLALHELAGDQVSLTLIESRTELVLHALALAEPFGNGKAARLQIAEVAAETNAVVVRSMLERVNPDARTVVTSDGDRIPYDALIVAIGARPVVALRHALTWWPGDDHTEFARLIADAEAGRAERIAFVVPSRCAWALPAYELALMTARRLERRGRRADVRLITPEPEPMAIFGAVGSAAVMRELDDAGIVFSGHAIAAVRGSEHVVVDVWPSSRHFPVDRVVALPRACGPELPGLRADIEGFIVTDKDCHARGVPRVWALGDATSRLPMHGGLAALQADCAAREIAVLAGAAGTTARPYTPVLRAQLRTGEGSLWLQRDISDPLDAGTASDAPLWSPPGKIAARRLGAVIAAHHWADGAAPVTTGRFRHETIDVLRG
jgi:sulfide:quinone oxidoreductase